MKEQLISPAKLLATGLWTERDRPSVRTLQNWISRRILPSTHQGRRRFVPLVGLQQSLQLKHRWPKSVAGVAAKPLLQRGLIKFSSLLCSDIWHPTSRPCARTLRTRVRLGDIPHYRIGRSVYFDYDEVVHCEITAKLVAAA